MLGCSVQDPLIGRCLHWMAQAPHLAFCMPCNDARAQYCVSLGDEETQLGLVK